MKRFDKIKRNWVEFSKSRKVLAVSMFVGALIGFGSLMVLAISNLYNNDKSLSSLSVGQSRTTEDEGQPRMQQNGSPSINQAQSEDVFDQSSKNSVSLEDIFSISENEKTGGIYNEDVLAVIKDIESSHQISMNCILQNPELPTGCEATSLTMVLNFLGYSVDKTVIASKPFLECDSNFYTVNDQLYGPDFHTTFVGSPFSDDGYGCLAPAIVNAANRYLNASGDKNISVINISGSSPDDLYQYIDKDIPVIVWATMYMDEPYNSDSWHISSGELVTWPAQEHCLVLIGYNNEEVILNDPLVGTTTYDRSSFEQRYAQLGSQAIVLKKS